MTQDDFKDRVAASSPIKPISAIQAAEIVFGRILQSVDLSGGTHGNMHVLLDKEALKGANVGTFFGLHSSVIRKMDPDKKSGKADPNVDLYNVKIDGLIRAAQKKMPPGKAQ